MSHDHAHDHSDKSVSSEPSSTHLEEENENNLPNRLVILSHGKIIVTWPFILTTFFMFLMWSLNLADARVLSWVCFLALWMTLAVTYLEFGRNVVLIGGLIAILLVTIVLQRFGLHALPESFHFLEKIPAPFTAYLWLMTGIFMALLWIPEYFGAWWYYKWEFTPAVIRHIMPGGDTIEYRLEQVIVTFTTGDWFERLVCGTGTIILKDRVNHKVLAMIENVWDLKKKEAILQKLLPRESL